MGGVAAGAADIFGGAAAVDAGVAATDVAATAAVDAGVATASDVAAGSLGVGDTVGAGVSTAAGAATSAAGAESIPFQLADGTMGSISGGNILDASGNVVAQGGVGTTLGDLAGYAKTGAQLIGGIGQLGQAGALLGGGQTKPGVADPYAQYRSQAAGQLQNLLADPSTITSTPGYQFNLQQYMQQLQAKQASQGSLVGGGALLQAGQMGQQYATSSLQQQQNLLATLSGANQSPAGAAQAQQGINFGQSGAFNYGLQTLASGVNGVANPLQTLYSQYNQSSPSVS